MNGTTVSIPAELTKAYGKWLADQEWQVAEEDVYLWLIDEEQRYLVEGVTSDSEGKMVAEPELRQALNLMQHAPRMLRFMLRALETLSDPSMSAVAKNEHVKGLLAEVAAQALRGQGTPRAVARAVQHRQATRE